MGKEGGGRRMNVRVWEEEVDDSHKEARKAQLVRQRPSHRAAHDANMMEECTVTERLTHSHTHIPTHAESAA